MNITSIGASQSVYALPREKTKSAPESIQQDVYAPSSADLEKLSAEELKREADIFYSEIGEKAIFTAAEIAPEKEKFVDMYVPAATAKKYYDPSLVGLPNTGGAPKLIDQ